MKTEPINLTPSQSHIAGALKVTATFLEKAGTGKLGAWTVGALGEGQFTYYYNSNGWTTKLSEAKFFDDFTNMVEYMTKRKIVIVNQNVVNVIYNSITDMTFYMHKLLIQHYENGEMTEGYTDEYLQVNYRMTIENFRKYPYIKLS